MTSPSTDSNLGLGRARTADGVVVVHYRPGDETGRVALVDGEAFDDLPALLQAAGSATAAISQGAEIEVDDTQLLAPIGWPHKIICVGQNYIDHVKESGRDARPPYPDLFPKWDNALAGPFDTLPLPPESDQIDYEAELAVVIGRSCRRVPRDKVADVVFGYTAALDGSVRDFQAHTRGRTAGKAWDRLSPIGPVVVPAAVLGGSEPDLKIRGLLNGEVMQEARTSQLLFGIPDLITYVTTFLTLEPGDLIFTGTPAGVGIARTPPRLLTDTDSFEVRIEGIGSLKNRFVAEQTQ